MELKHITRESNGNVRNKNKILKMNNLSYRFANRLDRAKERFSECTNRSRENIQNDVKKKSEIKI